MCLYICLQYNFSNNSPLRQIHGNLSELKRHVFFKWWMPLSIWPTAGIWLVITLFQGKLQQLIRSVISYDFYCCWTKNLAIKKTVHLVFIHCRGIPHAWKINEKFLVHCLLKISPLYSTLIVNPLFDILTNGSC